ncbi:MAG: RNase adapter RapZ [Desulfarculaceae bacterium]|jgi:UPF0042 nucleotide-binding protein
MSTQASRNQARFVVITGLSGSGKSTALKALEDVGYYAVDNLPIDLLPAFVNLPLDYANSDFRAALVMDVRAQGFVEKFPKILHELHNKGVELDVLFLEAKDEALLRRYSQTRRQHPLAGKQAVIDGIKKERKLLAGLKEQASQVVDTSRYSVHELRAEITRLFSQRISRAGLQINLITFGYKHGLPAEADLVMDVRFLANPYFVDSLQALDGRDQQVVDFIFQKKATGVFLSRFSDLLDFLLPEYQQEGKSQITIAIGCTGGRHRSVAVGEWLARKLDSPEHSVTLRHRDIDLG